MFGEQPRPRALLLGFDDILNAALSTTFATTRAVAQLSEVRQQEYDVLLTTVGVPWETANHLFVLAFGGRDLGVPTTPLDVPISTAQLLRGRHSVGNEVHIADGLDQRIVRLLASDIGPAASARGAHQGIAVGYGSNRYPLRHGMVTPWLLVGDAVIACEFERRDGDGSRCWVLPDYADVLAWANLAQSCWGEVAPDRFPSRSNWLTERRWWNASEKAAADEVARLEEHRTSVLRELRAAETAADDVLTTAHQTADEHERRLLLSQGNDLVTVVTECLEDLGFEVDDMDSHWPSGQRSEDLRIRHVAHGTWEAICEVRGYQRGAALSDLMRLQRFAHLYERDGGHAPSACWYVVNPLIGEDPAARPQVLRSNEDEVDLFVKSYSGALIDTARLFELWISVQEGAVARDAAAARLVNLVGRLT